jgi:acyl transferase domain-containing protein/fermentation-respiration switch protein FrsA (DUF1100 family)
MGPREDQRELLQRAVAAVKELRSRLDAQQQRLSEPIAIVGIGCRFPGGADSPDDFWSLLERGASAVADIPEHRFPTAGYYDPNPDAPGKIAIRRAAFLNEIDKFDADFFGISAREAIQMEPQQRLSLEVAWEALEDAGQTMDGLSRSATGVFMGAIATDYVWRQLDDVNSIDAYSGTGTHSSLLSGRLSYFLDLRGPSLTLDSACSSSLVAVHLACQSLRQRECNLALAGGVNVVTSPVSLMSYSRMGLLAPDGLCKTFDSRADGFVPGEGCGVAVLKRLSDALADGDNIRAVIRGSAVNQDGRSSTLTAPNGPSQIDVLSRALANAGVSAERIGCVEAHGTGTALGDPIEVEALRAVLDAAGTDTPCALASVKTNIGHLGAAAGIAGLIKMVLALQHKTIPRHLNLERLSPHISLDRSRLFVPLEPVAWTDSRGALTGGVSSFGWSGTNAHVIVEEAPQAPSREAASGNETYLLPLSARSPEALVALSSAYAASLNQGSDLHDLCATAALRRTHHKYRAAVTGQSAKELIEQLADLDRPAPAGHGVAFVFCGQGALSPGAGQELYRQEAVFRASLDETDSVIRRLAGWSVLDPCNLDNTRFAQPIVFALQVALARLWQSWGIEPSVVVGHSVGEVAAAHISGVLSLEDAVRVVVHRAVRMEAATGKGAMVEVELTSEQAQDVQQQWPRLAIAAYNSPTAVVFAGTPADVAALTQFLEGSGIRYASLRPPYAFHSPQMEPYVEPLVHDLQGLELQPASVPFYSTVHGAVGSRDDFTARYWGRNVRQPVLFSHAIGRMIDDGYRTFLEIGPHPVLSPSIASALANRNTQGLTLASLHRKRTERGSMLASLGALFGAGASVRFRAFTKDAHFRPLPLYPWQRKRYWLDVAPKETPAEIGCFEIVWERVALAAASLSGNWLLIEDAPGGDLARRIEAAGASCTRASLECIPDTFPENVLLVCPEWPLEAASTLVQTALRLAQTCLESRSPIRLWFLTRGAQPPNIGDSPSGLTHAPLIGLGRTLAVECPHIWGGSIDLPNTPGDFRDAVLACLAAHTADKGFAVTSRGTYVPKPAPLKPQGAPLIVHPDRSYLITGGLGGVGLAIARGLVSTGARRLMLLGRSQPSAAAAIAVAEMESMGASCTVFQGDISVRATAEEAISLLPDLAGVVHAAGILRDATISSIVPGELPDLLSAKVGGAWNLHEALGARTVDFFVMCSSLSSVLGAPGQASYSAANAFLDCLAHHRKALGLPALTINWGPWTDTGMTAHLAAAHTRWADQGIASFSATQGAALFLRLAETGATQVCAATIDWPQFRRSREQALQPADPPELSVWMRRKAAKILKVEESEIAPERNLMELGFDSLMVMELLRAIHQDFKIRTYPRELYQHPSISAFAAYLLDESAVAAQPVAQVTVASPRTIVASQKLDIPVVFLLSAPRSGSTLLRVMLAGHPGVFCPPELHLLGFTTMRERSLALQGSYLQEGLQRAVQELTRGSAEEAKALEEQWVADDLTVQAVYARLHEMAGGRLVIDKSPSYAASPDTLKNAEALFTSAKYIHLLRHPISVIDSFVKNRFDRLLGLTGQSPRVAAEKIWIESNANVSELFQSIERVRTTALRYEDLVRDPEHAMRELCAFLSIPFHEGLLKPYEAGRMTDGLQTQSVSIGDPGFLNHKYIDPSLADVWRNAEGASLLGYQARRLAVEYDYELPASPIAASAMTEQRVEVRGLSLCLCSWGPVDGPPVFILHGALDHGAAWNEVAISLAGRGFRVYAPDHRGHGLSQHAGPEGSYSLMDFLADADTLLRQVTSTPVTLVGHSMGASLAAMLAAARPELVSRLVLVEAILTAERTHRSQAEVLLAHLNGIERQTKPQTFADASAATRRLREFHPALSEAQAEKMTARLLQPCPEGFRWRQDERLRSLAGIAYHGTADFSAARFLAILSELRVPITLVRGSESEAVPLERIARDPEVLRGGHNLHLDSPTELARIISGEAK